MFKIKNLFLILFIGFFAITTFLNAQDKEPKKSPKAAVSQVLGLDTQVSFEFCRPAVKGRTIWGELVPFGLFPGNKYSDEKPFPWRGGANENSTIEFTSDLLIDGNKVAAGKYSMHFIPGEKEWKIMFNTVNDQWGSYKYDATKDVATLTVKPVEAPHQEWLSYGFDDYTGYKVTGYLHWEKVKVPFNIELVK